MLIQNENFFHHFQPIYCLRTSNRLGYEVLLRSDVFSNPEDTFHEARKVKRLYELDSRSIHKAVMTYLNVDARNRDELLFINVFPSTILNPSFHSFLKRMMDENPINSQQIVLEISETELIEDVQLLKSKIIAIRKLGFLIAIDDVGKGYSNFQAMIELEPNYLKLDRYFSKDLHLSKRKQEIILFFSQYCKAQNITLVLEGLESESEVSTAKALGIPNAQGYFLGRPNVLEEVSI